MSSLNRPHVSSLGSGNRADTLAMQMSDGARMGR
jgi:hypothetical protein